MAQRQLRHRLWQRFPEIGRSRIERAAAALPQPSIGSTPLRDLARHVSLLQQAIHGDDPQAAFHGRFRFLGREVDFGGIDKIEWRRTLDESSSPLWRLTLAYFGWAVSILAAGDAQGRGLVARALQGLERSVSWSAPGVFRDIWNPYTASHRLINLLAGLSLAPTTPDDDATRSILDHARFCAAFVAADLERDLQVNHLFKNYTALAVYNAASGAGSKIWQSLEPGIRDSLNQLILADGGHVERSPMYHALGLLDMRLLRDSAVGAGSWQPMLESRITATEHALSCLTHPDGDIALFNDSWIGGAPQVRAMELSPPPDGRHDLPITGYSRLGSGQDCVILDCGPLGPDFNPGHGHADFLSLEASVGGQRLIVDPGTPTYVAGVQRELCRSAAHHNGPHISGIEPVEFWRSFRVGRRATAGLLHDPRLAAAPLWTAGWHDGYRDQHIDIRRWVGLWPGYGLVVVDWWQGNPTNAMSRFLIGDNFKPDPGNPGRFAGRSAVGFYALAGILSMPEPASYWLRYGEGQSATVLRLQPDGGTAALAAVWGKGPPPWPDDIVASLAAALIRAPRVDNSTATVYGKGL